MTSFLLFYLIAGLIAANLNALVAILKGREFKADKVFLNIVLWPLLAALILFLTASALIMIGSITMTGLSCGVRSMSARLRARFSRA